MQVKRKTGQGFSESAAASDLAFLLIIYFLAISGFNINMGFLVELPAQDARRMVPGEDILRFELDRAGGIIHQDAAIGISLAESLIRSARAENPGVAVVLGIDPQAQWQSVVSFVELAQQMEIEAFSFSMTPGGPP
ncbi:MAG: biopolymer transporter ExbD [Spirochaetes bacterium]|nr:biopolymer transporter ExbD [Spirochaetota bacterium]